MRAHITEVACGLRRNHVNVHGELHGDWWVLDEPVHLVNSREDTVTWHTILDRQVIQKTIEAPAHAGASVVGGAG